MKYRTVLIFSEVFCLLIFFHFLDSGLSVLNDLDFKSSEKNSLLSFTFLKPLEKAAIASLQSHKESIGVSAHFSFVVSFA